MTIDRQNALVSYMPRRSGEPGRLESSNNGLWDFATSLQTWLELCSGVLRMRVSSGASILNS